MARTWWILKSGSSILGPKSQFLAKKSDFCHTTPILINSPFVALGEAVHFPPWERFSDFPFQSYSSFCKKNPVDPSKSLPPPHWGGTVSASNSPSALRWPDSEGQRIDSQTSWSVKPLNGKQIWPTSCWPTTTTYVANHSGHCVLLFQGCSKVLPY